MRRLFVISAAVLVVGLILPGVRSLPGQDPVAMKIPAPELQGIEEWLNSKPLKLKDQKGKVVVLHFWTFG
jgi:hypothetical protein